MTANGKNPDLKKKIKHMCTICTIRMFDMLVFDATVLFCDRKLY